MSAFPSLPLFTDAWVADTKHLSRLERGTYHDLLILMWRTPECRVPNDDDWLARRMAMTVDEVQRELRPIIIEFCNSDGNWITQKRLRREYNWCAERSGAQSVPRKPKRPHKKKIAPNPILSSPKEKKKEDDGERAREPLISADATALADEITVIVGHDVKFVPPAWCGAAYTVSKWLREGWNREIIIGGIRAAMARKRDGPPDSINYFEKPIARFLAQQATPLPVVKVPAGQVINGGENVQQQGSNSNVVQAGLRRVAELRELARGFGRDGAEGDAREGNTGDGTGDGDVRLLAQDRR